MSIKLGQKKGGTSLKLKSVLSIFIFGDKFNFAAFWLNSSRKKKNRLVEEAVGGEAPEHVGDFLVATHGFFVPKESQHLEKNMTKSSL